MYSKEFYIESSDVDSSLDLKLSSLMRMMQDVATEHAEKLKLGKKETIDVGKYWVISRYSISIEQMPKYTDTIKISTYPGEDNKFIYPRNFFVENKKGEKIIKASSLWLVLSKDSHRPILNPFPNTILKPEQYKDEEPRPNKIEAKNAYFLEERKVRYSDIDLNGHLNNTKYIEYVMDLRDSGYYKEHEIKKITINYEKELMDGQSIKLYSSGTNPEYIVGKRDEENIFEINIEYRS